MAEIKTLEQYALCRLEDLEQDNEILKDVLNETKAKLNNVNAELLAIKAFLSEYIEIRESAGGGGNFLNMEYIYEEFNPEAYKFLISVIDK